MKFYVRPEVEELEFVTEKITDIGFVSNDEDLPPVDEE